MFSRDKLAGSLAATTGRVALLMAVAAALLFTGHRLAGIETGFFDLGQQFAQQTPPDDIVILRLGTQGKVWDSSALADLIDLLHAGGTRAAVIAEALPEPVRDADVARLRRLIAIEERTDRVDRLRFLAGQLARLEERNATASLISARMAAAGNVVIALPVSTTKDSSDGVDPQCRARIAASSPAPPESAPVGAAQTAHVQASIASPCGSAAAVGHLLFNLDREGTVRRQSTPVMTPFGILPPLAQAGRQFADPTGIAPQPPSAYTRRYSKDIPEIDAATLLSTGSGSALNGRFAVIAGARPAAGGAHVGTDPAVQVATELGNLIEGSTIQRPGWLLALEVLGALLVSIAAAMLVPRRPLMESLVMSILVMSGLMLLQLSLLVGAALWLKLATLALFCPTAVILTWTLEQIPTSSNAPRRAALAGEPAAAGQRSSEELDLAFSVLRQQTPGEETKRRLYELAMEHGRNRDYARAERVFRYLSSHDPDYRDVAMKLEKLSGARAGQQGGVPASMKPQDSRGAEKSGSGSTLGRYEIERVLGRGAMATVYLGRDPMINRRVAIKTVPLAEEFAENEVAAARAQFLREAESSGRLNHPDIISIYDAGETNDLAYLAMEYFEGKPLSHYAQVGRLLPPMVVMALMARAAEALHYAHTQNVVHRDIKPANILYHRQTDALKITDFGIARLTDSNRTRTGIILGTPSYMSPEQLSASKVTGQSDIYSLGVTMYHLLTGNPPFQADSIPKLMAKIASTPHRPIRDVRDDVPVCADDILDRALAKDPADRFPSARVMAFALRECCNGERI